MIILPIALCALSGCVNFDPEASPDHTRFYVLSSVTVPPPDEGGFDVSIRRVDIPGHLDRSALAIRKGEHEINYRIFHRWSGDLRQMIARAMAEGLNSVRTEGNVTTGLAGGLEHYLDIEIIRFEGSTDGAATVSFQWLLIPAGKENPIASGQVVKNGTWDGEDIGNLVDTLARLLREGSIELAAAFPGN